MLIGITYLQRKSYPGNLLMMQWHCQCYSTWQTRRKLKKAHIFVSWLLFEQGTVKICFYGLLKNFFNGLNVSRWCFFILKYKNKLDNPHKSFWLSSYDKRKNLKDTHKLILRFFVDNFPIVLRIPDLEIWKFWVVISVSLQQD